MEKKYQVFVSSTFEDLEDERDDIIRSILEMGHIPVGMEMFSAADEEQWKVIARTIDSIDYYVVVLAHRYGSVTPDGISYTEKEFDYAASKGVPTLGFIIDDGASWQANKHEVDPKKKKKLATFKTKVKKKLVHFWTSREDLRAKSSISLMKAFISTPRTGWVRADEATSPLVTNELTRLSSENAKMREELARLSRVESGRTDAVRSAARILLANKLSFLVRVTPKWDDAKRHTKTLGEIFIFVAPNLINENSSLGIAQNLALKLVGTGYHKNWPVGKNQTEEIIADFATLDLVEPSKKKHGVADTNSYWSLTALGKQLMQQLRKLRLEEALATAPVISDVTAEPSGGTGASPGIEA